MIVDQLGLKYFMMGKEAIKEVYKQSISQQNNMGPDSPFSTGQLLDELGFIGKRTKVDAILMDTFIFLKDL